MASVCAAPPRVLIADDQPDMLDALRLLLKPEQIEAHGVTSPQAALDAVSRGGLDLVLLDLNYTGNTTSGREGIDLLTRIQAIDPDLPVIAMTGWGSVNLAVEAMRHGVRDFVQKPWDNGTLLSRLRAEIEQGRVRRERRLREARDLDEARRIQRSLLPAALPTIEGWEIAATWQPASGVGGDCYDVLPFDAGRAGITIADVVGKGMPAALLMSSLQAAVRAFARRDVGPADLCRMVNRVLCGHVAEGRFISFCYAVLDRVRGAFVYCNAGHHPPILLRADGTVERLTEGGPVLGVLPGAEYAEASVRARPGDRLLLFTDGVTEARNGEDEEFGEERLVALLQTCRFAGASAVQAHVTAAVAAFTGGALQDDATVIVLASSAEHPGELDESGTPAR